MMMILPTVLGIYNPPLPVCEQRPHQLTGDNQDLLSLTTQFTNSSLVGDRDDEDDHNHNDRSQKMNTLTSQYYLFWQLSHKNGHFLNKVCLGPCESRKMSTFLRRSVGIPFYGSVMVSNRFSMFIKVVSQIFMVFKGNFVVVSWFLVVY